MEIFNVKNLTFTYPGTDAPALNDVNLTICEGEIVLLWGGRGCGKTTLLSHLKPVMAPYGVRTGTVEYCGQDISALSQRQQAAEIGYVLQNPRQQIVTDKVWHEMAFGCENLGLDMQEMHRRVAETANFFGIDKWFHRDVATLSGGQKQLLNLACVMVMQPKVLILDEPTASLDPVAANEFLNAIYRINSELGTTVIIAEHRTQRIFGHADKVVYMENGRVITCSAPDKLLTRDSQLYKYLPVPAQVRCALGESDSCPVDIRQGRSWLKEHTKNIINKTYIKEKARQGGKPALVLKDVCFRYDKDGRDILRDCSLTLSAGSLCAVIGGNGSGKSTLLKVIAGINKHYSGKVVRGDGDSRAVYLPQEANLLFSKETVLEELEEMTNDRAEIERVAKLCHVEKLYTRHPYDISVGQGQCAALAKILLTGADIILLDEVTRGIDAQFKEELAGILRQLCNSGKTVVMVSHDIEFCAQYADTVAMFFDGGITARGCPQEFFTNNSFYTTQAVRMTRDILKGCVTAEDIINLCKQEGATI